MGRAPRFRAARQALGLAAVAAALAGPAEAGCRQALVLALDVSGSVDDAEYRLQLDGVAHAIGDPRVRQALLSYPEAPVALMVFEWSSARYQRRIVPWTLLEDDTRIDAVIGALRGWRRAPAPQSTGIGAALGQAEARLAEGPYCWRSTVDVSADGKNNDWPAPRDFYASGGLANATVNALVIGGDQFRGDDDRDVSIPELMAYFQANVIHGPDAFIEVAIGYSDYADAMTRKLLKELETVAIGLADPADTGRAPVAKRQ